MTEDRTGYVPDEGEPTNEWISGLGPEWIAAVRSGLEESLGLSRRALGETMRMAADVRAIKARVMGEE